MKHLLEKLIEANSISTLQYNSNINSITKEISFHLTGFTKILTTNKLFSVKKLEDIQAKYPFIKNSEDISIQNYTKAMEKKIYKDISNLIQPNINAYYEACLKGDLSEIYEKLIKEVQNLLNKDYIKEEIQEILQEMGEAHNKELLNTIKNNLAYNILQITIPKYLRREVPKCTYDEKNNQEYTLLQIACEIGNFSLVANLIAHGWDISFSPTPNEIAEKGINETTKIINNIIEISENKRSPGEKEKLNFSEQKKKAYENIRCE